MKQADGPALGTVGLFFGPLFESTFLNALRPNKKKQSVA